jgi:hypothetical protein
MFVVHSIAHVGLCLRSLCTCSILTQVNRAPLTVTPPAINPPINGGIGHSVHGLSWDEMFAVCKFNTVMGLPSDDSQIRWMFEQRRRKEKLDRVGFTWNDTEQAEENENTNKVSTMEIDLFAVQLHCFPLCIQFLVFDLC